MDVNQRLRRAERALIAEAEALVTVWEMSPGGSALAPHNIGFLAARLGEYKELLYQVELNRTEPNAPSLPRQSSIRRKVVEAVAARWRLYRTGCTSEELESLVNSSHQTVSSAATIMVQAGLLMECGKRPTRSGWPAAIYKPTPLALDLLRAEAGL